jgi:hypothetical protein
MCVDCVLSSSRIAQVDPGNEPLLEVVLSHWGTIRGSLEDSRIGPNTMEASNRPRQTDLLMIGPTGHVNPFVDIEINSS